MIRFKTFRKALRHIKKINITDIQTGDSFSVEKAVFDTRKKEYAFLNADRIDGVDFVIRQRDISLITRENTDDDNEFVFLINTRDGKQYGMTFFMQGGYSFFVPNRYEKENIKSVITSIPKYLCGFKGKRVKITKTTNTEAFSTWNPNNDNEDYVATESFIISDFDYEVKTLSGLTVVDLLDKDNTTYAKVLGAIFVVGDTTNGVMIGVNDGDYILKIVD